MARENPGQPHDGAKHAPPYGDQRPRALSDLGSQPRTTSASHGNGSGVAAGLGAVAPTAHTGGHGGGMAAGHGSHGHYQNANNAQGGSWKVSCLYGLADIVLVFMYVCMYVCIHRCKKRV
jgi:hypothetical protein